MDSSSSSHSALTTYGGWAVLLLVAGYVFTTYQNGTPRRSSAVVPAKRGRSQEAPEPAAPPRKKVEKAVKQPKKVAKPAEAAATTTATAPAEPVASAEELAAAERKADREFARQLSSTHAGHTFTSKKADEKRAKSVKQSKAEQGSKVTAAPAATTTEVSHGEDADDDLSPQASPVVEAAPSNSNDVSDMLEAAAPGPSVLRLTGTDAVKAKQPKAKAPEVVETKKQRQNRKKAEAAKAAREEDEKERKVLLEQQRRTARIAEGRAAKDGSGFVASQQNNAWTAPNTESAQTNVIPLLDTFEATPAAPAKKQKETVPAAPPKQDQFEAAPPQETDSWNEVKTKKKGKQSAPAAVSSAASQAEPVAAAKPATNGVKKPLLTSNNSSFAAIAPEETEDVDEEWDV
ncbi:uncharacterized protein B0I36DRAFT_357128 [Microdochium trichocladiopsis]|uniref:Uncharacterized protein n=1 Tax=Microdochium trichocladiopsis TaxID=1682393 RepID=A0A9P9BUY4_9PEZI|nr:uncharacterized protein B0I36DRAFT_357128 [Microdochium trichocladiopsis]KAH7039733.1 hypothetical protein B0I36DRAFT_357128 [Microdochium trichocladiopsis]